MKKKLITSGSISVLLIFSLMVSAFVQSPVKLLTDTARKSELAEVVEVKGNIKCKEEIVYSASVTAPLIFYQLKIGDEIKEGDVIAQFDATDYERAYEQAVINLSQASDNMNGQIASDNFLKSRVNEAKQAISDYHTAYLDTQNDSNNLDIEQFAENYTTSTSANALARTAAYAQSMQATKNAELNLAQYEKNYDDKDNNNQIKELILEVGDWASQASLCQMNQYSLPLTSYTPQEYAQQKYNAQMMEEYNRVWTQAVNVKTNYESRVMNSAQVASLQDSVDLAQLYLDIAAADYEKASNGLVAGSNGIVVESYTNEGAYVTEGTPICKLLNTDEYIVDVSVSKYDISKIAIGQSADITLGNQKYEGTVTKINKIAETESSDKPKVSVEISIDNPDEYVFIGLEADVNIHAAEKDDALIIPYSALYSDDEGEYCYVIDNGIIAKKYIETGLESGEYVEVISGINSGDVVITDSVTNDMIGKKATSK